MIKRTASYFAAQLAAAPVLVIPFSGKRLNADKFSVPTAKGRIVARADLHTVKTGIITMSPIARWLQEVSFVWDRWAMLGNPQSAIRNPQLVEARA